MARRHGWELPAHSLQIVAITVYFLLTIAFYAFFAPFVAKDEVYEYVAIGGYTFLALGVLILYARCTAIDPADPGILIEPDTVARSQWDASLPGNASSVGEPGKLGLGVGERSDAHRPTFCSTFGGIFCFCLVREDCRDEEEVQQSSGEEEALFCTLCNAEVRKFSKHCRSCDKCVDGFDHHCRWLNNCVGRKNYYTFVSLMAMSLLWLLAECCVGIWVFVRCFVFKVATEHQIIERLGDGFSRPVFATIVALGTTVSFLAIVPLGELFFFHMILIRKGITTYEYVIAMRTQSEPPGPSVGDGEQQSLPSSPTGSQVTATSGRSSVGMGLQIKGSWCTPPRIFMDQQDEIEHLEPGTIPSTVDPDALQPTDKGKRVPQRPVRISAWKLAKLDSKEAMKAAAKARASSSVLRPVSSRPHPYDSDQLSSSNISGVSSPISMKSSGILTRNSRPGILRLSSAKSSYPPSRASREDIEACARSVSNISSPRASQLATPSPLPSNTDHFNPMYQSSANQSPLSSRAVEMSDNAASSGSFARLPTNKPTNKIEPNVRESTKNTVYWDPEAGRFVSSATRRADATSSSVAPRTELSYSGQSIFFGGPLLNENLTRGGRSSGGSGDVAGERERGGYFQQGRSQRGSQLPVFVPSDNQSGHLPSRLP